jgi:hypothetical protein
MIEAGGVIQLGNERRKVQGNAPFVAASTGRFDPLLHGIPPWRRGTRDWLDDQYARACAGDERFDNGVACRRRKLVEHVCGDDSDIAGWRPEPGGIALPRLAVEVEVSIRPSRFIDSPRVSIDPDDARRTSARHGPCRAGRSGPASEIDNRFWCACPQRRNHVMDDEEMQRRIEQGEGRALAGGIESGPARERVTAFDVRRRQRTQRARDLRETQVGHVPRFERRQPLAQHAESPIINHQIARWSV